jgi:hypothetical protein
MSRLLGRVRRKMLSEGLPAVLADIGDAAASAPAARCGPGPELAGDGQRGDLP